jgi:hypothetical protein
MEDEIRERSQTDTCSMTYRFLQLLSTLSDRSPCHILLLHLTPVRSDGEVSRLRGYGLHNLVGQSYASDTLAVQVARTLLAEQIFIFTVHSRSLGVRGTCY